MNLETNRSKRSVSVTLAIILVPILFVGTCGSVIYGVLNRNREDTIDKYPKLESIKAQRELEQQKQESNQNDVEGEERSQVNPPSDSPLNKENTSNSDNE